MEGILNMQTFDLEKFLKRSTDKEPPLMELLKELPTLDAGTWIAGGVLRRAISNQPIKEADIDMFFENVQKRDAAHTFLEKNGFKRERENEHNTTWRKDDILVQTIHISYYADVQMLLDSFDFTICQLATDGVTLWVGPFTLWDIARKRLALNRLTYGVATVRRLIKYTRQGFTACGGVMADILDAVVKDPEVIQREVNYLD